MVQLVHTGKTGGAPIRAFHTLAATHGNPFQYQVLNIDQTRHRQVARRVTKSEIFLLQRKNAVWSWSLGLGTVPS